jgi:PAS domain S-box-containing protein
MSQPSAPPSGQSLASQPELAPTSAVRFEKVFESIPNIAVQGYLPDGTIRYWNKANEAIYGYTAEEAIGRNIVDLVVPPAMRDEVRAAIRHGAETGELPPAEELTLMRKDGTHTEVFSSHAIVTAPGQEPELFCLDVDLRDRKRQEARLNRVNAVLLELGDEFERNVQLITAAGGELLAADCALYNRIDGELLCAKGQWRTPPAFKAEDAPEGHLCYDVIHQASSEPRVILHLPETAYAKTDPNVAAYGLRTYVGCPVRFGGRNRGSLCVVYGRDYQPSADDLRILRLLAAAIGQDEERTRAVAALRLKDWAIEASIAAIAISDRAGHLTYVNGACLTMWGYAGASEVLGRLATEFWDHPGQAEQVVAALAAQGSWVGELTGRRKDGSTFGVQLFAAQVKDAAGQPVGLVGSFVDLTERQQAQEQVRASEERLANVVNTVPDGITQVDRTGRIVFANTAAERILRLSRRELTQRTYDDPSWKITTLDGRPFPDDELPFIRVMRTGQPVANIQHAIEHPDGTRVLLSINAAPVRGAAGATAGMVASITDITERKRTEGAMRENEERLRLALAGSNQGLFDLDLQSGQASFTPEYATMLGYDPAGFRLEVGSWTALLHPDDRAHALATLGACVAGTTRAYTMECRLRSQAGDWVWVLSSGKVVAHDAAGRPARLIGVHFNITERKQAEQDRLELERRLLHAQKLESLGILAGGIAHDFNNLLMGILGNLDLALMDLSPVSPARACIQQSVLAARRAADLTRQMLAYSGRGSFVVRSVDLNDLVEENAHLFRACISKLVTLDVATAADLPRVKADPGQFQQVIMNLITNASESIGHRPGVVHLRTGIVDCDDATLQRSRADSIPPAGRFVYLEVADTGCGMDADTQQRLFDPFFTTKFAGRGLGMSAILGIVRGHDGAIFLESAVGQGTTIRVLFPAESPEVTAATVAAARPPGQPAAVAPSGTILVVDDEDVVRRVSCLMLAKRGWRVLEAADGLQAIDLVRQHAADIACVLLDLSMPHMGGIEVLHTLRLIRSDLPIILSSGYSNDQGASKKLTADGLAGFIQKPYTSEVLLGEIARVLKRP